MASEGIKGRIAAVLNEDKIKSRMDSRIVNYSTIALIILSVVQVIAEINPRFAQYESLFQVFDVITIGIFTIEYQQKIMLHNVPA